MVGDPAAERPLRGHCQGRITLPRRNLTISSLKFRIFFFYNFTFNRDPKIFVIISLNGYLIYKASFQS